LEAPKTIGSFEVRRELGRGSGGVVFEAWDEAQGRAVALKLYTSAPADATGALARLLRDAEAAGGLGHPNLAEVLAVGLRDGQPWVAAELVEGVSLAEILRGGAPWPVERVLDVWRQLCEGLAHAHREGILHVDLKPSDVRIGVTGEVKIVDFGSWHLKALEPPGPGPADEGLHYRAPEILSGRRPDRRADVFSAGAIVYELVGHRKAFPGDTTTDVVRELTRCEPDLECLPKSPFSPDLERLVAASLARDAEARPAAFEVVHAELVRIVREVVPRLLARGPDPRVLKGLRDPLVAVVLRAQADERWEEALEACHRLLALDPEDEWARRVAAETESTLVDDEIDEIVARALAHAADGEIDKATALAEKVERLDPWSPRYLELQVYLDEEQARCTADRLVATGRGHLAEGRAWEARAAARDALTTRPDHEGARRLLAELSEEAAVPVAGNVFSSEVAAGAAVADVGPGDTRSSLEDSFPGEGAALAGQLQVDAAALSTAALRHFLADEHREAREMVDRALALDPANRRALELQKILRAVG
jgi:tetratricopeptide (TPR) repeat protein